MPSAALRYDPVSRLLHWGMAALILGLWAVGLVMEELPKGDLRGQVFGLHKAFGVVVLVLAVARLWWRTARPAPAFPETMPAREQQAARLAHGGLMALMILLPLDGILMSQSGGREVSVFGWVLPNLIARSETLHEVFEGGHAAMAWILAALVTAHVAAALRHHFVLRDGMLFRMLPATFDRK